MFHARYRRTETLGMAVLLCAWGTVAGTQDARPVTLEEALAAARANNALLQAARLEEKVREGRLKEARSFAIPALAFTENFSRTTNPGYAFMGKLNQERITLMDFDPRRLNDPAPLNNWNSRFEVGMPLFTGGKLKAARHAAEFGVEAARNTGDFAESSVAKATTEAFYGSLLARRAVAVTREAVKTAEAHRDQVEALRKEGMVLDSDFLRIQVYTADLKQQLSSREADESVAKAYLGYAMGTDEAVEPQGDFAPPESPLPAMEEAEEEGLKQRGDLAAMALQAKQAGEGITMAKADYLPQVGLMGAWEWNTEEWSGYGENWMVGLQVRLPLFDGGARSGRLAAARAQEGQAQAALLDLARKIRVEVRDAWLRAKAAAERLAVTADAEAQSRENQRIVELRYQEGMASVTDLLDADTALLAAGLTRAQATHELIAARARLSWATGEK